MTWESDWIYILSALAVTIIGIPLGMLFIVGAVKWINRKELR